MTAFTLDPWTGVWDCSRQVLETPSLRAIGIAHRHCAVPKKEELADSSPRDVIRLSSYVQKTSTSVVFSLHMSTPGRDIRVHKYQSSEQIIGPRGSFHSSLLPHLVHHDAHGALLHSIWISATLVCISGSVSACRMAKRTKTTPREEPNHVLAAIPPLQASRGNSNLLSSQP